MELGEKKMFENDGTDYSALKKAKEFLKENGYSYGSLERGNRIAFKKGDFSIAKWSNLSDIDLKVMDGYLWCTKEGYRKGNVCVVCFDTPPLNIKID